MTTVVLSAASPERPALQALSALVLAECARQQQEVRVFELATMKLAYCQGEFDCWVKTPGACRAHDQEQAIVQAMHDADNVVFLDEQTFGGHSYTVKRAQDRMICLLSPFFEKRAQLTHHAARYARAANLFALGWTPAATPALAETWAALADANALNMLAPGYGAALVDDRDPAGWAGAVRALFADPRVPGSTIGSRAELHAELLAAAAPDPALTTIAPRSVAFLIGSAKPKGTSASERLARAMADRFARAGATTALHHATSFVHDGPADAAARAITSADLVVLATPLYVDALPAPATHALEVIARVRTAGAAPARFATIINCGFPEAEQTRTALRIARHFADAAGYDWAGGLPLGGGGMIKPDHDLDEQHGPMGHVQLALDLATTALARGAPIPLDAIATMAKAPLPDAMYRLMGDLGWRYQAHRNGLAQRDLRRRPLDPG